jgi:5-methylcytosine-specific restriction endonuclease McrA
MRKANIGQPCPRCGVIMVRAALQVSRSVTVDHITPLALGGTNDPWNLRVMCRKCNCGMGGRLGTSRRVRRARIVRLMTSRSW